MKEEKLELKSQIRVVLRFTQTGKVYSVSVPLIWSVKKMKNFISYAFRDDIKNNQVNLYYGAKLLTNENLTIGAVFPNYDKEEIYQIIVNLKPKDESFTNENKNSAENLLGNVEVARKEILSGEEFEKLEIFMYFCYKEIVRNNTTVRPNKDMLNKFPLMHPNIDSRVKIINEKSKMAMMEHFDPENIENYPLRDYVKIEVFFKLFLFFILFGGHIKGYNIPFFISLLLLYYWYCLHSDITAFYDKKISEFKLTANELKDLKFIDYDSEDEKILEKAEDEEIENLQRKISEDEERKKLLEKKMDNSSKEKEADELQNKLYEDIKIENENIIHNTKNEEFNIANNKVYPETKEIKLENDKPESKKIYDNEIEDITHLLNKIESKKAKKLAKEKKQEGFISYYVTFLFEILYTSVMSLIPLWCDEFERHNPIITLQQNEVDTNTQNNPNGEGNINQNSNANDSNYDSSQSSRSHNLSIPRETETKNDKHPDYHESEKILIKSSNDTRLVNPSEDQNKYYLVEENENKTENEFVFSENVNIDTLSYNEPIIESWKKKHEKETEKEQEKEHYE